MGKKKPFINKKNSATFHLLARDSAAPAAGGGAPTSDRVFVRVDNNPYSVRGLEDDDEIGDSEAHEEFGRDSIFADAPEDADDEKDWIFGGGGSVDVRGALPDHVRKELILLALSYMTRFMWLERTSTTGGPSGAEVYDPYMDRWEDLPPMPFPLLECISVSYGGEFHVVGKKSSNYEYDTYVIFNPLDQKRRIVELGSLSKLQREYTTVANGCIYSVLDDDGIRVKDADTRDWHTLGAFPAIVHPGHVRPLKPFGFSFVGFKKCLYFLGGMALRFDSDTRSYDVVDLNNLRYFDPKKMPSEWHDARPMPDPSGNVIGGALEEE